MSYGTPGQQKLRESSWDAKPIGIRNITRRPPALMADVSLYLTNVTNGRWLPDNTQTVMEYVPIDPVKNQSFGFLQLGGGGNNIPTPEPAGLLLLGGGVLGLGAVRRMKNRSAA
jgi:hypothetical protein